MMERVGLGSLLLRLTDTFSFVLFDSGGLCRKDSKLNTKVDAIKKNKVLDQMDN